ncbi:MAG: TolC family protein [Phycisphaeraceae bacterium]|nr:TolC family protein [Phycisphaeraceae bacterium]
MNRAHARRHPLTLALISGAALASCSNPLAPIDDDYGARVSRDRLRSIDSLDPTPFRRDDPTPEEIARFMARPSARLEGLAEVQLSLETVRASTLENNLDLRVALVDPVIQSERLRQEEAKFEAVFRPSVRVFESDRPTFNVTDPNQQEGVQFGAGVDIPLRTGGRVSVDLVEGRSQTNNPFVTLGTSYNADTAISISQPLLRNAGRRASTYSIRIAAYDDQITQARTKLEVIRQLALADRAYWRLYAARRDLEVAQRQYELAVAQLERARARVRAGDAPQIEIIRAEAGVAAQLEAIINAENVLLLRQRELKRVVNIPDLSVGSETMVVTVTEPDPVRYDFDGRALTEQALTNRMEMLELELRLAADLSTIEFTKNQALPLFTLDYVYSINGLGDSFRRANTQMAHNNFESWTLSLNGQIPIGNEAAKARVQQAILTRLQRLSTRDARMQAIEQEVLNAIDVVELGWKRILAARQAAITAARTLEAEQRQFDAGARTSTDVLDAATRLADAQRAEVRAIADYEIGLVDLGFATGTLLGAAKLAFEPFDPRSTLPASVVDPVRPAFPPAGPGPSYTDPFADTPRPPARPDSTSDPASIQR